MIDDIYFKKLLMIVKYDVVIFLLNNFIVNGYKFYLYLVIGI